MKILKIPKIQQIVRRLVPKSITEAVLVCLFLGIGGFSITHLVLSKWEARRGAADATADIANRTVKYWLGGRPRAWEEVAIEIAAKEFGVHVIRTRGSDGSGHDVSYDAAYNRVVRDHYQQEIGFDPIERAFERAREQWTRQNEITPETLARTVQYLRTLKSAAGQDSKGEPSAPAR